MKANPADQEWEAAVEAYMNDTASSRDEAERALRTERERKIAKRIQEASKC